MKISKMEQNKTHTKAYSPAITNIFSAKFFEEENAMKFCDDMRHVIIIK